MLRGFSGVCGLIRHIIWLPPITLWSLCSFVCCIMCIKCYVDIVEDAYMLTIFNMSGDDDDESLKYMYTCINWYPGMGLMETCTWKSRLADCVNLGKVWYGLHMYGSVNVKWWAAARSGGNRSFAAHRGYFPECLWDYFLNIESCDLMWRSIQRNGANQL